MTKVVNCKRHQYDVYIGRPTKWGNPFIIGRDGTRYEVIKKYRRYLLNNSKLLSEIESLRNKVLGCFCAPLPCHGDVLVEFLNRR